VLLANQDSKEDNQSNQYSPLSHFQEHQQLNLSVPSTLIQETLNKQMKNQTILPCDNILYTPMDIGSLATGIYSWFEQCLQVTILVYNLSSHS
jgi:hypothetical protein